MGERGEGSGGEMGNAYPPCPTSLNGVGFEILARTPVP